MGTSWSADTGLSEERPAAGQKRPQEPRPPRGLGRSDRSVFAEWAAPALSLALLPAWVSRRPAPEHRPPPPACLRSQHPRPGARRAPAGVGLGGSGLPGGSSSPPAAAGHPALVLATPAPAASRGALAHPLPVRGPVLGTLSAGWGATPEPTAQRPGLAQRTRRQSAGAAVLTSLSSGNVGAPASPPPPRALGPAPAACAPQVPPRPR